MPLLTTRRRGIQSIRLKKLNFQTSDEELKTVLRLPDDLIIQLTIFVYLIEYLIPKYLKWSFEATLFVDIENVRGNQL